MTSRCVRGGFTSKKSMEAGERHSTHQETGFDGNSVCLVDEKGKPYVLTVGIAREIFGTHDTPKSPWCPMPARESTTVPHGPS